MEKLEYSIDQNGQVVRLRTLKGEMVEIGVRQVKELPAAWSRSLRQGRFDSIKRSVIHQTPNVWYIYGPFTDDKELKRAQNSIVSRQNDDTFLKEGLNGHKLFGRANYSSMELALLKQTVVE